MRVAGISKWTPILRPGFRRFFNLMLMDDSKLTQAEDLNGVERQLAADLGLAGIAAGPGTIDNEGRARQVDQRADLCALRRELVNIGGLQGR